MRKIILLAAVLCHSIAWGAEETGISRIHAFEEYHTKLNHTTRCRDGSNAYFGGVTPLSEGDQESSTLVGYRSILKEVETNELNQPGWGIIWDQSGMKILSKEELKNLITPIPVDPAPPFAKKFQDFYKFAPGSLVGDIQQSILDSDRFWLTIRQKRYSDALKMALSNSHCEQQNIWKEAVLESTKERIVSLVREEFMEFDKEAAADLFSLVRSFEPLDRNIYADLKNYSDTQRKRFEQKKSDILQSPALKLVQADLHRLVINRLLHAA